MRAVSCCSGGVLFIPDTIERKCNAEKKKTPPLNYKELSPQIAVIQQEAKPKKAISA